MTLFNSSPKHEWIWIVDFIVISTVFTALYHFLLGAYPLISPDEGRYSEITREMLANGHYITPMLNHIPFLDKPPLFFWLQSVGVHYGGLNEYGFRLWPATVGALGCLLNYIAGYQLANRLTGYLAATMLGSSVLYFAMAHFANLDLTIAFFITATLYTFYFAIKPPYQKKPNATLLYLAYVLSAFAILTKGMIGLVFPVMIILIFLGLSKRWALLFQLRIPTGLLLIALIIAPWFYLVSQNNPGFWHYYIVVEQIQRFLYSNFNNHKPVYFYLCTIILGFFPWLFYLIFSFFSAFKQKNQFLLFCLCWVIFIVVFFSIPESKLIGYILPVFYPLSLILAYIFYQNWSHPRSQNFICAHYMTVGLFLILAIAGFMLPQIVHNDLLTSLRTPCFCLSVIFFIGGLGLLVSRKYTRLLAYYCLLFMIALSVDGLVIYSLSHFSRVLKIKSTLPLTQIVKQYTHTPSRVFVYQAYYQDIPFYLRHSVIMVYNFRDPNIRLSDQWTHQFSIGLEQKRYQKQVWSIDQLANIWHQPQRVFVYMEKSSQKAFAMKMPEKIYVFGHYKQVILVSNQPKH